MIQFKTFSLPKKKKDKKLTKEQQEFKSVYGFVGSEEQIKSYGRWKMAHRYIYHGNV
jgi:hypothetical protein